MNLARMKRVRHANMQLEDHSMRPDSELLARIKADERYQANLDWGEPRAGHPEGTVRAHIRELEENLQRLRPRLLDAEIERLLVLIHVHDTFKPEAKAGAPIQHAQSHASLARSFLAEFTDDPILLAIVQSHDEPFALWRQFQQRGHCSDERFAQLLTNIGDWNLFAAFLLIDGCTPGKGSEPLEWFLPFAARHVPLAWTAGDARALCRAARPQRH